MAAVVILNKCTGCGACVASCPLSALTLEAEHANGFCCKRAIVNKQKCHICGNCISVCPHLALVFLPQQKQ
ncbi:4Fe-4S binding protein [Desulfuromusa kysingii]|uniref:4Fe-4S binding protein n=1 Tax=Desulfuromusa kysingii TaxID=37625 RepID=UPI000B885B89|nr:4Fe-4S binding protein [Desulfuromusa kysingii]